MESNLSDSPLSQMATQWSLVQMAHRDQAPEAKAARRELLDRYGGAARRYLLGAVRDPDAAEELFQEFAVRLMQGDLRGADKDRGRFRHYVKAVLSHLTADHFRQRQRKPQELPADVPDAEAPADRENDLDAGFLNSWREELLARAWQALADDNPNVYFPFTAFLGKARLLDQTGHSDEGFRMLDSALDESRRKSLKVREARTLTVLGQLAASAGRNEEAIASLTSAADVAQSAGLGLIEAEASGALAPLLRGSSRHEAM